MQYIPPRTMQAVLSAPIIGALAACSLQPAIATPPLAPTLPPTHTKVATLSPQPPRTRTATPSPTASPFLSPSPHPCDVSATPLVFLDDDVYFSWGPNTNQLNEAIIATHPQWKDFGQFAYNETWSVGGVYNQAAYCGEGCGVNPAILLIGVSMRLRWQVPPDGDLWIRAGQAAREFYQYYLLYHNKESVRQAYPQIGNAATYSLFRFFGKDLGTLQEWCNTYEAMFGEEYPLKP